MAKRLRMRDIKRFIDAMPEEELDRRLLVRSNGSGVKTVYEAVSIVYDKHEYVLETEPTPAPADIK